LEAFPLEMERLVDRKTAMQRAKELHVFAKTILQGAGTPAQAPLVPVPPENDLDLALMKTVADPPHGPGHDTDPPNWPSPAGSIMGLDSIALDVPGTTSGTAFDFLDPEPPWPPLF
jgi:hypothetical protein